LKTFGISFLTNARQHLIFVALPTIAFLLAIHGSYFSLTIPLLYPLRFRKKSCWFLLAAALLSLNFWVRTQPLFATSQLQTGTFEAQVLEVRRQNDDRQVAVVRINEKRAYLSYFEGVPRLNPGDRILAIGELTVPGPLRVRHAFDFGAFLRSQNIRQTLMAQRLEVTGRQFSPRVFQRNLSRWVDARFPTLTAAYLNALFLGVREGMDGEVQDAFSNLGIIHVFAISGMHVGLLGGLLALFLKRAGLMEEIAAFVLIVFLLAFTIVSGGSPSIVRAAGMGILAILNRQFKWGLSSLDIFSLLLLGNIALAPHQIWQVGFIYSYWISFSLIMSKNMLKGLSKWRLYLLFPFIAQLAALPLTLFFSYGMNPLSYVANLILVPIVTLVLIPSLLATLFISPLSHLLEPLLQLFESLSILASRQFGMMWVTGAIGTSATVFLMLLFLAGCYAFERCQKWAVWAATLAAMVLMVEGSRLDPQPKITFLDVGQGDSIIVQSKRQSCNVVVDTGGQFFPGGRKRPIFHQTLQPYLLGEGIRRIDYLVLTHGDFDHIGEARALMDQFPVSRLLVPQAIREGYFEEVLAHAKDLGIPITHVGQGDVLNCGGQAFEFLQPARIAKDENDASLVKLLSLDGVSALLTGDIGFEVEPYILRALDGRGAQIYKGAHHGSRYSNSLDFMGTIDPVLAVVQAGEENRFGHPTPEWSTAIKTLGITQFDTPTYGTIQIRLMGEGRFSVSTSIPPQNEKNPPASMD